MDAGAPLGLIIVTAAHCLPELPPAGGITYTYERTYAALLGALGGEAAVTAECLFVDPVSDLAVLVGPDSQELSAEADAFDALLEDREPIQLAASTDGVLDGAVLSLDNVWQLCQIVVNGRRLTVRGAAIDGGMSGSPIVVGRAAVGVVGVNSEGLQLTLDQTLPMWLFRALRAAERRLSDVTMSKADIEADAKKALEWLIERLPPDDPTNLEFTTNGHDCPAVAETTWPRLERHGYISPVPGSPSYELTLWGWREGLLGLDETHYERQTAVLRCQALFKEFSTRVNRSDYVYFNREDFETQVAAVPYHWASAAVKSGLLSAVFPERQILVDMDKMDFRISSEFGQPK